MEFEELQETLKHYTAQSHLQFRNFLLFSPQFTQGLEFLPLVSLSMSEKVKQGWKDREFQSQKPYTEVEKIVTDSPSSGQYPKGVNSGSN